MWHEPDLRDGTGQLTPVTLELALSRESAARVTRLPGLAQIGGRRPRGRGLAITWHDAIAEPEHPEGTLAAQGLVLAENDGSWTLERLWPGEAAVIASGPAPGALLPDLPEIVPVAHFIGRRRALPLQDAAAETTLALLDGELRVGEVVRACHRVRLAGAPEAVAALAARLAAECGASVPATPLAGEAALARGLLAPVPDLPAVPPGLSVADAFAHVAAPLAATVLYWAGRDIDDPRTVHQMRVGVRRLRSALKLFRLAIASEPVVRLEGELRDLAAQLGAVRDWDVFTTETVPPAERALDGDRRLRRLAVAAGRRRAAAHADLRLYLASLRFRLLALDLAGLAGLRRWEATADPARAALLAGDSATYAALILDKHRRKMRKSAVHIIDLPGPELHNIRKRGKTLRYACEFFAPLFPAQAGRRFIRALSRMQERLGHVNDAATATALIGMLETGRSGFAAGAVLGYIAGHGTGLRRAAEKQWRKFRRADPFWT